MSRPFSPLPDSEAPAVLTVSELNEIIRNRLETGIDALWVTGELSNVRFPPSGHVYFTLKDRQSQISAVLFRRHAESLRFRLEDGMEVVCSGRVSLYTVRGALQFYAVEVEARGKGALAVAFEQLKQRLSLEGLFDAERKKPLPFLPRTVGIVTSLHGAAVRDMLSIIGERFPDRRVVIRPVRVQGRRRRRGNRRGDPRARRNRRGGRHDRRPGRRLAGGSMGLQRGGGRPGHRLGPGPRGVRRRARDRRDHR